MPAIRPAHSSATIGEIAWREDERRGAGKTCHYRMYLAVVAALRWPDRLKIRPFSAVGTAVHFHMAAIQAACFGGSEGPATDANIFCQTPFSLEREKRL
jgi:hypothetical protein